MALKTVTSEDLTEKACAYLGLPKNKIFNETREQPGVSLRWALQYVLRKRFGESYTGIARRMGFATHGTVIYGVKKIQGLVKKARILSREN